MKHKAKPNVQQAVGVPLPPKRKKKISFSGVLLGIMLFAGLGLLLYPTVSDWWNSFHQSRAVATYQQAMEQLDDTDYEALFAAAYAYNDHLKALSFPFTEYEQLDDEYYSVLDVAGNGVMGTVHINAINVDMPIYHGTSSSVLNVAAGHIEGTTLPIGGESTHSVISAHRGLPSARLFTDLDKLVVGDVFTVDILNQTFTYQVDQILIVEPTQMEALNITQGQDYCTLQTCTPYGINTHRLLVRGRRIDNIDTTEIVVTPDAVRVSTNYVIVAIGVPLLLLTMLLLLSLGGKKPGKSERQILDALKTMRAAEGAGAAGEIETPETPTETGETPETPDSPIEETTETITETTTPATETPKGTEGPEGQEGPET